MEAPDAGGSFLAAVDRFVDRVGRAAAWLTLAIVVLMATNVLLRYAFSIGSVWSQELEWHLLAPMVLAGMTYALSKGEHVRVDVLYASFSPRAKHVIDLISAMLGMALSLIVIWLSIPYIDQSWSIGEGSSNPGGIDARYVVKSMIPLGFAMLFLQSLAQGIRSAIAARSA